MCVNIPPQDIWSRHSANLDRVLVGEEVDDLESVRDDADSQELLSVVAALHHQATFARLHEYQSAA